MKKSTSRFLFYVLCGILLPVLSSAQTQIDTHHWVGSTGFFSSDFDQAANWENGDAPIQANVLLNLFFGVESDPEWEFAYRPYVNGSDYRVYTFTVTEEAQEAYTIQGNSLRFAIVGGGNTAPSIHNQSNHLLTFEAPLDIYTAETGTLTIHTGAGGVFLAGGALRSGNLTRQFSMAKNGLGSLILGGPIDFNYSLAVNEGELRIHGATFAGEGLVSPTLHGASIYAEGDLNAAGLQVVELGDLSVTGNHFRANRITVDPVGAEPLLLNFATWIGNGGADPYVTLHFDLSRTGSSVRFDALPVANAPGEATATNGGTVQGVPPFAVVTGSDGLTGFAQLVGDNENGWSLNRLDPTTLLPTSITNNNGSPWNTKTHYYVDGNHTLTSTGLGRAYVGETNEGTGHPNTGTLTIQGTGTLTLNNYHLRASYILLQEGEGDYTIAGLGLATRGGHNNYNYYLKLYQYRTDGDLILNTDHIGFITNMPNSGVAPSGGNGAIDPASISSARVLDTVLVKSGPGTVVLQSPTSNLIGGAQVQEGRLQVIGNALTVSSAVAVYDGILGGSGQIGGGIRWVRNVTNTANITDGIRYTQVTIASGGTLDVTPDDKNTLAVLRGLQIHGTLLMDEGSALSMQLTTPVLTGAYDPLRVIAEDPLNTTVELNGDLQLHLQDYIHGAIWIVLFETTGSIAGEFSTVNGQEFGVGNSFVLSYDGVDYDVFLQYGYDLGGGFSGVVLHSIPEPTTITLLFGVSVLAYLIRRNRCVWSARSSCHNIVGENGLYSNTLLIKK
jgi:autotransporter-associated beta strand protein